MANALTLTALTEVLFESRDIVAKEPTGYIQGATLNTSKDGVSINGTVQSFATPVPTLNTSITPAMTIPAGDDQTIAAQTLTIGQTANVRIPMRGEDWRKIENTSGRKVVVDMFAQAIRKIRNTIETHVGSVAQLGASRAFGTAGTTPFASTIDNVFDVRQILVDNGAPLDGQLSLVLNTTAGTKLRKVPNLYKANEAGTDSVLRRGELMNLGDFSIRESAGVALTVAGGMTGALFNGAGAVGDTTITFDTGTVNTTGIKAGDVLTISNYKYVVATGTTSTSGTFVIAAPGLREVVADNTAITVNAAYTSNTAFHRQAIELVMRPPALPEGGDAATDRMIIADDTGLVFEVAEYQGYKMKMYDFTTYYQAKVWKSEFVATLLG
jgi:hypothetical protein